MLQLKHIRKDYVTTSETVNALKGVSISFRKQEFVSILGPSGCGKTTLLNIIGGLDHYTSGNLVINGVSTDLYTDRDWDVYRNHRVGFIFQSYNLIPHQTVLGNVELALTIAGISKEERIERAKRALDRVGLSGQYYKRPNQLSGGQCQRVAIARALVNDPEILLADEPTGALDTVTSVQIMELIKEISGERLVIMVTHNPELAEQYSTRIVRLLDGNIIEDTNPMTDKEEEAEAAALESLAKEEEAAFNAATDEEKAAITKARKKKKEKAKMSFFTAFRLSLRNLISKKGRTAMVGIAGSIGIIGIALVLAFSAGIKGYVAAMQDDMLSGNPIMINETTYDLSIISDMMKEAEDNKHVPEAYKIYIDSLIEYIATMTEASSNFFIKNDINQHYVDYIKAMPKEYYSAMTFDYGIDLNHSIYVDFTHLDENGNEVTSKISVAALTAIYTSVLEQTDYKAYASYIPQLAPNFEQAPNNPDYIKSQYDVYGEVADDYDEVMIVLSKDQKISDLLLARLGIFSEAEFYNLIYKNTAKPTEEELANGAIDYTKYYDASLDKTEFNYDDLIGYEFTWYPNEAIYQNVSSMPISAQQSVLFGKYLYDAKDITADGVTLKITGILVADEDTDFGCLSSGIYYSEALTDYILDKNSGSTIAGLFGEGVESLTSYITYNYTFRNIVPVDGEEGQPVSYTFLSASATVGESLGTSDLIGMMGSAGSGNGSTGGGSSGGSSGMGNVSTIMSMKFISTRFIGANKLPNNIAIYPVDFNEKDMVTGYLDAWNDFDNDIYIDGVKLEIDRTKVTYTDTLGLIINVINTMIDVVSYALIAFTSVSLVVSTVMIGIITYVSVVERIKEIGVIRSLGGRKRDVSNLFIAETFIIGLLAGLIGVAFTYFVSAIVNVILHPLINYASIAALPVGQAILLVLLSVGLTLVSGLIPASSAAKKDPVVALRTE